MQNPEAKRFFCRYPVKTQARRHNDLNLFSKAKDAFQSILPLVQLRAVAWVRNSISNGADPDSWINDVGPTGVALLQTLYPLPPASNPGDSEQAPDAVRHPLHGNGLHPRPAIARPDATAAHRRRHQHRQDLTSSCGCCNDARPGSTRRHRHPIALGLSPKAQGADDAR